MTIKTNKKPKKVKTKKEKPVYNEFVYSPALQNTKKSTLVLGFLLRVLIIYTGVLGMTLFLCDAFKVPVNALLLAVITLIPVALFSLMSLSNVLFAAGLSVSVGIAGLYVILSGNPVTLFLNTVGTLWNHMLDRLDVAGYRISYLLYLPVDTSRIFTEEELNFLLFQAMIVVIVFLSVVFTASVIRRVHILPLFLVGAVILTSVFTYNISATNWGFSLIISAVCGILSLKMYDSLYNRRSGVKKGLQTNAQAVTDKYKVIKIAANGGFVGFISMALCFLVLLLPTINVKKQWETIGFINSKMELGRAIISSIIIGETPDIDMGFLGNMDTMNSRTTVADTRTFTGKEMLRVYASYNMPLYLRSWTATSYHENSWSTVSSSKAAQYQSLFGSDFTPEIINYNFYNFIDPRLTTVNSFTSYTNRIENGFIAETIDIQNVNSSGNLLFLPSTYDPEFGLMEYLASDISLKYEGDYKFYYEGILSTSWFNFNKQYRAVAFVPSYRYENYSQLLGNNLRYYQIMQSAILSYAYAQTDAAIEKSAVEQAKALLESEGVTYTEPIALERYFALDGAGREKFIADNFQLLENYSQFVYDEYLTAPQSSAIDKAITNIIDKNAPELGIKSIEDPAQRAAAIASYTSSMQTHELVLSVIGYLRENYEYSLDPKPVKNVKKPALDSFLDDTKEGYCVQFATSAAMILRTMGVPTRYVEGYLVNNLKYDKDPARLAKYYTTVKDFNAHAWIEVYLGAAGWMLYETTPPYYTDLYEPYRINSSGSGGSSPEYLMPEPEELDDSEITPIKKPEKNQWNWSLTLTITVIAAVIAALAFAVYIARQTYNKSIRAYEKRYEVMNRALRAQLEPEELREVSRSINDYVWELHALAGCMPQTGELPAEYVLRVDDSINFSLFSFKDIFKYMSKEEFGRGMARWELREEAEYMQVLWEKLLSDRKGIKKFIDRHIRRVL